LDKSTCVEKKHFSESLAFKINLPSL